MILAFQGAELKISSHAVPAIVGVCLSYDPHVKTARQLDREIADHQERARLTKRVQKLLDKWQPILGVTLREFRVRKMRAFGSLDLPERRLWVSQSLADMSPGDLEYVVVHELVHLRVDDAKGSGHDDRFYALMDRYLPIWRRRHVRLRGDGVVATKLPGMDR
jgi:predicted metal-dependent hydrolase